MLTLYLYMNTWRILDLIQSSTEYLRKKGVPDPRLDAEYLLGHILEKKRLDLYMVFDQPLGEDELSRYREFIKRRGRREPLQHILGHTEFMGLMIKTTSAALIPRPETEVLVELAEQHLEDEARILDIGTGTGCIAVALAKRNPGIRLQALDINTDTLALAVQNAEQNAVSDRIRFFECDILQSLPENETPFDLVVSNPPYIAIHERDNLQQEVRDHDPDTALIAADDGFQFYNRFNVILPGILKPGGRFIFEFGGAHQVDTLQSIFKAPNYDQIDIIHDYNQAPRFITGLYRKG